MADSPRKLGNGGTASDLGAIRSAGRRRLLQAAVSTAPVVMTVLSRPVLATGGFCQSPSGFVSGNASNPGLAICQGRTPDYWATNPNWPSPYQVGTTLFSGVFTPDLVPNGMTFQAVLEMDPTTSGPVRIARLCVAAALNVAGGESVIPSSIYTLPTIKDLWTEFASSFPPGVFHPTTPTGPTWDEAEIIDWLSTTMSSPT